MDIKEKQLWIPEDQEKHSLRKIEVIRNGAVFYRDRMKKSRRSSIIKFCEWIASKKATLNEAN